MGIVVIMVIIDIIIVWAVSRNDHTSDNKLNPTSDIKHTTSYKYKSDTVKMEMTQRLGQEQNNDSLNVLSHKQHQETKRREGIALPHEVQWNSNFTRRQTCKSDWHKYQNILNENNINTLYHFTDMENLQSIKRSGALYSWHYCLTNNIEIPVPGGGELSRQLDRRKGLQNYVRVSFTRSHPMMYVPPTRANNCVILEIDPEVIFWHKTKYADKNATRNDVNIGSTIEDFKRIKFNIVKLRNHFDLSETDKSYYQGEILVFEKIPVKYIRNLYRFIIRTTRYDNSPFKRR